MKNESERLPGLVILISGTGSNMLALAQAIKEQKIPANLLAVISDRNQAKGLEKAKELGITTQVVNHQSDPKDFQKNVLKAVKLYQADLVLLAGFMRVLNNEFIHTFYGKLLNIHPSLLPKYPGLNTHLRALKAQDKVHGTTVHFVNEQLDQGPVIVQGSVPVLNNDTPDSLAKRVREQEHKIYPIVVKWFCEGRLKLIDNQVTLDGMPLPKNGVKLTL